MSFPILVTGSVCNPVQAYPDYFEFEYKYIYNDNTNKSQISLCECIYFNSLDHNDHN